MGVLGELWVKLGLKNEEFKKGIDEAQGKTKTFGEGIKKVSTLAKAAWAAVGAAIVKLGVDMTKQTQVVGDKWGVFTAGLSAAYNEFVSRIGSGAGWDNLIADMREAARVAKEVQMSLDELFERNNSLKLQEIDKRIEIAKLRQIQADATKTDEERITAGERAIALEKEIMLSKIDVAKQEYEANKAILQQRTKMTDADLEYFIANYNGNREQIQQAIEYRDKLKEAREGIKLWQKQVGESTPGTAAYTFANEQLEAEQTKVKELQQTTSDQIKAIADLATRYDLSNDEMVENFVNALLKMKQAVLDYEQDILRIATRNSSLEKSIGTSTGEIVGKAVNQKAFKRSVVVGGKSVPTLNVEKPDTNLPKLDFEGIDAKGKMVDEWEKETQRAVEIADIFNEAVAGSIVNSLNSITDAIANGESLSFGQVVSNLLTPLADAAISAGMLMLSTGTGIEALKDSLMSLNGAAAIAAGAALVAVGAAAKIGLASIGKNMGNANPSYTYSGGGYGVNMTSQSAVQQVEVTGVIKGQDIYLASEKYQQSRRR